jgi:ABC-type metal ion transport system substrate-binding protein
MMNNLHRLNIIRIFELNKTIMATKTFKIGEYCKGGIITVEITGTKVAVIAKDWDFSKGSRRSSDQSNAEEFDRHTVNVTAIGARREIDDFLNDLTSSYYSDEVLKWIETKVKFESIMDW